MRIVLAVTLLTAGAAAADTVAASDPAAPSGEAPVKPLPIPAQTTPAPPPDQASGVIAEDEESLGARLRFVPNTLLAIPRGAFWLVMQPLRGTIYVNEKYNVLDRATDAFFTDDRRFGLYPVGGYESGFGFTIGARALVRDLSGRDERLKLRADWGGRFRQGVGANLDTGHLFGKHFSIELDTSYERRPREKFYGIGDGDEIESVPMTPIDPTTDDTAIKSQFQDDVVRHVGAIKVKIAHGFKTRTSGAIMMRDLSSTDKDDITMRYDTSKLVGFDDDGVKTAYIEQELAFDTRRAASEWETQTVDGAGWLVAAHFGKARGIDGDPTDYYRYGGEIQKHIDIYGGNRLLALRVLYDAVGGTNGRTDGKIAFTDLPRLGGSDMLRGYVTDRFRDRAIALGTVEYTWAIGLNFSAFTFLDVGRAMNDAEDIKDYEDLRAGFGGGIQLHTKNTFLMRAQIAGSREGDVLLKLSFSPAFGRRERAGQY